MADYLKNWRKRVAEVQALGEESSDEGQAGLISSGDSVGEGSNCVGAGENISSSEGEEEAENYGYVERVLSSSESDGDEDLNINVVIAEPSLSEDIASWAVKHQITRSALTELLSALHKHGHEDIPKDARTLLRTPRNVPSVEKCGGQFSYFGIECGIAQILQDNPSFAENTDCIDLTVNIDGVPLFKSANTQLWPILCKIKKYDPFLVALYCGDAKPNSVDAYLTEFLEEYHELRTNGLTFKDKTYTFTVSAFICDAPARAFLKCVKGHTGYFSCERCIVKGVWEQGRVVFGDEDIYPLRNDGDFRRHRYTDHQKNLSPLITFDFPCVTGFALDYMHMVCLGVVKRMLTFLKSGPKKGCRLSQRHILMVSNNLITLNGEMPSEFARQPRGLDLLDRWKATEFRQFILYTGPIVLRNVLPDTLYKHFLALNIAMSIMLESDDDKRNAYVPYAEKMLHYFVDRCDQLYGSTFVVYNVHGLIHLAEDVKHFNCSLNDISAFPFENHLQFIKHCVRNSKSPISQCAKRIAERQSSMAFKANDYSPIISSSRKNQCIQLFSDDFAFIREVRESDLICDVLKLEVMESFFTQPGDSKLLGVAYISQQHLRTRSRRKCIHRETVKRKVACLSYLDGYVLFPLLHDADREW